MITLFTIGFTGKTAKQFFNLLRTNGVKRLVDIRLNNKSQLAGFAKGEDLEFFMKEIVKGVYTHKLEYAPTDDILKSYRAKKMSWENYEKEYIKLLEDRKILKDFDLKSYDDNCFLCSENEPDFCHRRLFVEFLKKNLKEEIHIVHLFK